MNHQPYLVPNGELVIFEEEIKKSLFITYIQRADSIECAKQFISDIKNKHVGARHACWAFAAGRPEDSMKWGCSDDGEPSGTAGKPMLAHLNGSGMGEIVAVVVRYSGGIKLGTGGLVKAYGGGVQQALKLVSTEEKLITERVTLCCDYHLVSLVNSLVHEFNVMQVDVDYNEDVTMILEVEQRVKNDFKQALVNKSSARITFSLD